ncbi:hypothetical protein BX600DRAFT_475741 [Xylariales sp. PMI_506]|nr:hypothetical protein BX600DRAFT_475741 [Xylariales sp. PMI_506]
MAIRRFMGHGRSIFVPDANLGSVYENTEPLLANSSKTDQIVSSLAQAGVSRLSCKGVGGAISLFSSLLSDDPDSPVPTIPNVGDLKLPDIELVVTNDGNTFQIGLQDFSAVINGVSLNKFIALLACHIVLMLVAFLALFPSVLIVGAINRLATAAGHGFDPRKANRWLNILQVVLLPLFGIAGLVLGILVAGNSRHFRTPHGILGIVLVAISLISSILSLLVRRRESAAFSERLPKRPGFKGVLNNLITALSMGLIFATWITGLEDLRALSLCIVDQVSITIMAVLASVINSLWDSAVTLVVVEWWIGRRVAKVRKDIPNGRQVNGAQYSPKQGEATHVDLARE